MNFTTIAIGDELLIGQVTDTNSGWIARHLAKYGFSPRQTLTVADNDDDIVDAIEGALDNSDLIITTGGLGPTRDDVTKRALCTMFGCHLMLHKPSLKNAQRIFALRGLEMNELTESQALVPEACTPIVNEAGTAPIMWFDIDDKVIVCLPGVPHEMKHAMSNAITPRLVKHFHSGSAIEHRTIVVAGFSESGLAQKLEDFEDRLPEQLHLAYLPQNGYVKLRLSGTASDAAALQQAINARCDELLGLLGSNVIATDDMPLPLIVGKKLLEKGLTMGTAESCTGGNIAHEITTQAGSSAYFLGSVVSYANDVKRNVLSVSADDLERYGAVSQQVVEQMCAGACKVLGADCAVATSGIAGPGGGTPDKPVGTVWIAAQCHQQIVSQLCRFNGDRQAIIERATTKAMLMLLELLMAEGQ